MIQFTQTLPIAFFEYLGYDIHKIMDRKEDLSSFHFAGIGLSLARVRVLFTSA